MSQDPTSQETRRAVVLVNEAVVGKELRDALTEQLQGNIDELFVVCPALTHSGLDFMLGDVDKAVPAAKERLELTLKELREAGFEARGEVGDSDPIQALSDEILKFDPEQVIVVSHRDDDGAFAEQGLLEQAERDFDIPVTELVVDRAREPHVLDVEESKPVAGRRKGWRPSYNWPPLSKRDLLGIAVAILGTLLLGALATECVDGGSGNRDHEEGRMAAACAARILIALAAALINLAHVVGLFLFQSVGYQGVWSRFFARLSLIGTPIAIVVSLLLGLWM